MSTLRDGASCIPIRVGFIGLSSSAGTGFLGIGTWAGIAHLPYLQQSDKYTITAICNSSLESAKKALNLFGLDSSKVQVYGDPESLAKDENVDLVVCCVNVAQHYKLCKPALLAGKMVYCEWPLAATIQQADELAALAKEKSVRTMIGLQAGRGTYVTAIKSLLTDESQRIGQLLSTTVAGYATEFSETVSEGFEYFNKMESGGNILSILSVHMLDILTTTLGDFLSPPTTLAAIRRPTINIFNLKGETRKSPNSAPDHVFVQGELRGKVPFAYQLRRGRPYKGTPAFDWRIHTTKAEIRLSCSIFEFWTMPGISLTVYYFEEDCEETIDLSLYENKGDADFALQPPADSIAKLYDDFAAEKTENYLDFDQSMKWTRFVDAAYRSLERS